MLVFFRAKKRDEGGAGRAVNGVVTPPKTAHVEPAMRTEINDILFNHSFGNCAIYPRAHPRGQLKNERLQSN